MAWNMIDAAYSVKIVNCQQAKSVNKIKQTQNWK
jgi:hypothetical protein